MWIWSSCRAAWNPWNRTFGKSVSPLIFRWGSIRIFWISGSAINAFNKASVRYGSTSANANRGWSHSPIVTNSASRDTVEFQRALGVHMPNTQSVMVSCSRVVCSWHDGNNTSNQVFSHRDDSDEGVTEIYWETEDFHQVRSRLFLDNALTSSWQSAQAQYGLSVWHHFLPTGNIRDSLAVMGSQVLQTRAMELVRRTGQVLAWSQEYWRDRGEGNRGFLCLVSRYDAEYGADQGRVNLPRWWVLQLAWWSSGCSWQGTVRCSISNGVWDRTEDQAWVYEGIVSSRLYDYWERYVFIALSYHVMCTTATPSVWWGGQVKSDTFLRLLLWALSLSRNHLGRESSDMSDASCCCKTSRYNQSHLASLPRG